MALKESTQKKYLQQYKRTIRQTFDFSAIALDCDQNKERDIDSGNPKQYIGRSFLGTVFSLCPSGKYHTFWANSNVSENEVIKDSLWYEALESVAIEYGLNIENSEFDPCDILAYKIYSSKE